MENPTAFQAEAPIVLQAETPLQKSSLVGEEGSPVTSSCGRHIKLGIQVLCHKQPLLGAETSKKFDLLRVNVDAICSIRTEKNDNKWTDKFADVFEGYGKLPGKITFKVNPKVPPVQMPLRRMPIAVHTRVKNELLTAGAPRNCG